MPGTVTHFWIFQRAMFDKDSGFTQHYLQKLESSKKRPPGDKFVHGFLESLKKDHGNFESWELLKNTHSVAKNPKNNRKKIEKAEKEAKKAKKEAGKAKKDVEDKKKKAELKEEEFQKIKEQCDRPGVLAGMGYIGSVGPDIFSVPHSILYPNLETNKLSALAHYNKTGALVIHNLVKLKKEIRKDNLSEDAKQKLQYKLAYWLGHIAHLTADIVTHPYVNSRAGALQMLKKIFCNNESRPPKNTWKTHNIVEHYQDAFVKHVLFKKEKRNEDWEHINFPLAASCYLRRDRKNEFIGKDIDDFYGQDYGGKQKYDKRGSKYEHFRVWFFVDDKITSHMSFRNYLVNVIPKKSHREEEGLMNLTVGKEAFEKHIEASVKLAREMMEEALDYLVSEQPLPKGEVTDDDVYAAKEKGFKWLQLNWNIDTGHGFRFEEVTIKPEGPKEKPYNRLMRLHVLTYPHGPDYPVRQPPEPEDDGERAARKGPKDTVLDKKTPCWCVEIIAQTLVRKKYDEEKAGNDNYYDTGLELWWASADEGDAEKVGENTREQVTGNKDGNKVKEWTKQKADESLHKDGQKVDSDTSSKSQSYSFDTLGMSNKQAKEKVAEPNDLLNKMIILTPKRAGVWDISGHSGRFKHGDVKVRKDLYPTEQVFLKFHVFDDKGKAVLQCDSEAKISKPDNVPLEPRIHNIIIELKNENNKTKIKKVSLDGNQMRLWKADELKASWTSTPAKSEAEKPPLATAQPKQQSKQQPKKPQSGGGEKFWCNDCHQEVVIDSYDTSRCPKCGHMGCLDRI